MTTAMERLEQTMREYEGEDLAKELKRVSELLDLRDIEKRAAVKSFRHLRVTMVRAAEELSKCGDYDHRSKNEVILRVIAKLLTAVDFEDNTQVMDDIQF